MSTLPSAFQLFQPSAKALIRNFFTLLEVMLTPTIFGVAAIALGFLAKFGPAGMHEVYAASAFILGLLMIVGFMVVAGAVYELQLRSARGLTVGYKEMLSVGKQFAWRILGLGICLAVIYVVSFVLFIVPFFFMLRRYYLSPYYLVDQNLSVFDALKASAEQSKQYSGAVWGLIGVNFLTSLIGTIPVIGWVIGTVLQALYSFAPAVRYGQMQAAAKKPQPDPSPAV